MKKTTHKIIVVLVVLGSILTACKKDFLNTIPVDQVQADLTWTDPALTEAFVNGIYGGLFEGGFDEQMLAAITDEALFTHAGRNINTINQGAMNPSNPGWVNRHTDWLQMYNYIRTANIAIANIPNTTFTDQALKDRLKGESHFLRAYFYHQLLRFYGGAPIISRLYALNEDYNVARNTYPEVSSYILKEIDTALTLLTGKTKIRGRATDLAVLALKSRQLLYDASDLHDIPTAKAKSATISAYAKPELLGFLTGNRTARWQAAKDAAKAVLTAAGSGYKTDLTVPVSATEGQKNFLSIAMGGGSNHPDADKAVASTNELLFVRTFTPDRSEGAQQHGLRQGPNGYNNWAGNTPIQEFVDDFEMMDGTKFNWNTPAHKADPYMGRDPRFYVSFLYDGSPWKPRGRSEDPANEIQTGTYYVGTTKIVGLDTRQGPIENWNGSFTGYYFRKFIDPDPTLRDNTGRQNIPWPYFRYTEALFNYVEACIELGEDAEARTWLNKVRFRAGMPAVTESGDALRQRYRNERRVEMGFEEQRFFDTRRWMIAPQVLGRKTSYIQVEGRLKPGASAPTPYKKDKTKFDYTYLPVVNNDLENRTWFDKMYYRPINLSETQRNKDLVQNPGYDQ